MFVFVEEEWAAFPGSPEEVMGRTWAFSLKARRTCQHIPSLTPQSISVCLRTDGICTHTQIQLIRDAIIAITFFFFFFLAFSQGFWILGITQPGLFW